VTVAAFAPGRANLIGEHTDYNGGLALPFAIERGVTVRVDPLAGRLVEAHAVDLGERDAFDARAPERASGWRAYVRGVVAALGLPYGMRIEISGDLPHGAGLSSSAALTVALTMALAPAEWDPVVLATLCRRVENDWAGSNTGLLDQLAILLGRDGEATRIDFHSLESRQVPLELGDWRLATLDSGAAHTLASSGYNERRRECEEAAALLGVDSLRSAGAGDALGLPEPLGRRVRHVVEENARVDATIAALEADDLPRVAELIDASHASLRDLYHASVPEVEAAVGRAKAAGAAGARMMGGGFGGVVLALFAPGAEVPADALAVTASAGARLL
jgi:galactokinase